jgi:hypothetical protein
MVALGVNINLPRLSNSEQQKFNAKQLEASSVRGLRRSRYEGQAGKVPLFARRERCRL